MKGAVERMYSLPSRLTARRRVRLTSTRATHGVQQLVCLWNLATSFDQWLAEFANRGTSENTTVGEVQTAMGLGAWQCIPPALEL